MSAALAMPWWLPVVVGLAYFACMVVLFVEVVLIVMPAGKVLGTVGANAWGVTQDDLWQMPVSCVDEAALRSGRFIRRFEIAGGVAAQWLRDLILILLAAL